MDDDIAMTNDQVTRYSRQMRVPEFGRAGQEALRRARVVVVGAGGLGSPVLTYLAASGVGSITVHDPDTVDLSNLHRQVVHDTTTLGSPKAISAAEHLRRLNPDIEVTPVVDALGVDNILDALRGADLVIDGADNFPTRYLVSDACEILDLPLVWGSILGMAGQLSVFHADSGRGVTYRDIVPVPPRPGEVPSCAEAGVLGMLCGVIGSSMAMEAVKVLTGIGRTLHGRIAVFDALRMRWDEIPLARSPHRAPVTALEDLRITCGLPGPAATASDDVSVEDVPTLLAAGTRIIDIRERDELEADGILVGAEHVPMQELLDRADAAGATGSLQGAVLCCAAGARSATARDVLAARGIAARSLRGGHQAVLAAGLPVTRELPPQG